MARAICASRQICRSMSSAAVIIKSASSSMTRTMSVSYTHLDVYKRQVKKDGDWSSAIKISESPSKTPTPGAKRAWRIYDHRQKATADLLTLEDETIATDAPLVLRHPADHTKLRTLQPAQISRIEPLHEEVVRGGEIVYAAPPLEELRRRRAEDVEALDPGVRRLVNPHIYHVSLSSALWDLKQELIAEARRSNIGQA